MRTGFSRPSDGSTMHFMLASLNEYFLFHRLELLLTLNDVILEEKNVCTL